MLLNKSGIKSMSNQQFANELHKPILRKLKIVGYILHLKTNVGMYSSYNEGKCVSAERLLER